MFFELLQQWQVVCKVVEWGKHHFRVEDLPFVLCGGDNELERFHNFLEIAGESGFSIQDLTVMHSDDLTQVFNECHTPATTRIVVRRVVSFPCTAMDGLWNVCKAVLMTIMFSTKCIKRMIRPMPLLLLTAAGTSAVVFVQQNPRRISELTESNNDYEPDPSH